MSVWDFDRLAPVLHAVGMASAEDEPLDVDSPASELGGRRTDVEMLVDQIDRMGLIVAPREEPEFPPALTRAGSQYLNLKGQVSDEILHFLPKNIDDLYARQALLHGGTAASTTPISSRSSSARASRRCAPRPPAAHLATSP